MGGRVPLAPKRPGSGEKWMRKKETGWENTCQTLEQEEHHEKQPPPVKAKDQMKNLRFQALLGAENTIRANRPRLAITLYHDTNHLIEIQEYLRQIHRDYHFRTRGIAANGNPVLLQVF